MPDLNAKRLTLSAKRGFTLIELLVVIAIIGILATFVVASFTSAQRRGRDARRQADLDAIKKALELYRTDTAGARYYPGTIGDLASGSVKYIKSIPPDPQGGTYLYSVAPAAPDCRTTGTCTDYRVMAVLENTTNPQITESQTRCLIGTFVPAIGASYPAGTYVVCPP